MRKKSKGLASLLFMSLVLSSGSLRAQEAPSAKTQAEVGTEALKSEFSDDELLKSKLNEDKFKREDQALRERLAIESQKNPQAMIDLASIYEHGDSLAPVDLKAAFDLYELAANKKQAFALQKICMAYLTGFGRPKDVVKASVYCNQLNADSAASYYWLGYDYQYGITGPINENKAMAYYSEAAKLGNGESATAIGLKALELERPDLAVVWFQSGIFYDSVEAMVQLAALREQGLGGPKSTLEAKWLTQKAADRGHPQAIVNMVNYKDFELEKRFSFASFDETKQPLEREVKIFMGTRTERLTRKTYVDFSQRYFLFSERLDQLKQSMSKVECFIDEAHIIDSCVVVRELPNGLDYGKYLQLMINQHWKVPATDVSGVETKNGVFILAVRWAIDTYFKNRNINEPKSNK